MSRKRSLEPPTEVDPLLPEWDAVLLYRAPALRSVIASDLAVQGVTPAVLRSHLADGGDRLWAAAAAHPGDPTWVEPFGGGLAVALLARESLEYHVHLSNRAAETRTRAVQVLELTYSKVTIAEALRMSRQALQEIAAGRKLTQYISRIWKGENL